jgi:hypothetical protein
VSAAELDDAAVWAWWCRNCEAQGVSPVCEDPAVIARVVTLAFAGTEHQAERGGGRRARAS